MAQEMVSVFSDHQPWTADSGYVGMPDWMDDLDTLFFPHVYWSRPVVLADGTVLFVSQAGGGINPFVAVPGEEAVSLLDGTNTVWEMVSAGGLHVYVRGEEGAQSLGYKTGFGNGPGFPITTPELVEMRHLRAAAGDSTHLVFTGKDAFFGFLGAYVLSFDAGGNPGAAEPIPGSGEGAMFPDVAADGTSFVFRRADGHILWRTAGDVTDLGPGSEPAISADGSTVCFVAAGTIMLADRVAGTILPIGDFAPGVASSPALSDNGRFVIFRSTAPLVAGLGREELAHAQIYLYDIWSRGIHCLTDNADGDSVCPAIEGTGRYLAFSSLAPSLGANSFYQVFRYDRGEDAATNTAPLLAAAPAVYGAIDQEIELPLAVDDIENDAVRVGILSGPTEEQGAIVDDDGIPVAAWSGNLPLHFVPATGFSGRLTFLFQARDREGEYASLTTEPVAVEVQVGPGIECLTGAVNPVLDAPWGQFAEDRIGVSGDGRWLLYGTENPDAWMGYKVWLHDTDSDQMRLVFESPDFDLAWPRAVLARFARAGVFCTSGAVHWFTFDENGVLDEASFATEQPISPSISDDGATVVFEQGGKVFVWRPGSGAPVEFWTGRFPALSGDGRMLACVDDGFILVFRGVDGVFSTNTERMVGTPATELRLSVGGRYLLYQNGTTLGVFDLTANQIVASIADAKYGELAASGSFVYYVDAATNQAHWRNLLTAEDRVLCADARRAVLSADGRFATLVSKADIAGGREGTFDIYRAAVPFATNQPPTVSDETLNLTEDLDGGTQQPLEFLVMGGDGDAWDRDLLLTVLEWPLNGSVEVRYGWGGITIVYTPDGNFAGTDTLVYQVTDGSGQSATGTIRIEIEPVDDPPELAEIPDQRLLNGPVFAPVDLDDYITEVDGDGLDILVSGQDELTVTVNGRVLTIEPPADTWSGSETITVTIVDQTGAALEAERSLVVANWYGNTVTLAKGWNAVAFPIRPDIASAAAVAAATDGRIYRWNGAGYDTVDAENPAFAPGQGYWLYVPTGQEGEYEILGHLPASFEVMLAAAGLSLVGPLGVGAECALPDGITREDVFHYSPARLRLLVLGEGETLKAGQAYWIRNAGPEKTVALPLAE
jgi:hypothetical protein